MKAPPVSGGFNPGHIGQLNESIGRYSRTESPPLRITGLEIGELLATDGVDKEIVGLLVQRFGGPRKSATERLQLWGVHERRACSTQVAMVESRCAPGDP